MKEIYFWSPCLDKVGTYKSTINSTISLSKYSKNKFSIKLINSCGEWDQEKEKLNQYNVELVDLGYKYFKFLPKKGFLKSRASYFIIFLLSIIPLLRILIKKKPDFLIAHLLTSLPLILKKIFNFKSNLILRISGYPKLNFIRKTIWKLVSKKLFGILCPSEDLKNQLINSKIFEIEKLMFIPDPIIEVKKFSIFCNRTKFKDIEQMKKKFFVSAGRLTKQKNFSYLILEFHEFLKENNDNFNLLIFGDGEEKEKLNSLIIKLNLEKKIFLMGYSDELFSYMKKAEAFILSSLWEDPGFVLIESAMNNLFIISSDCKNGPREFLSNGLGGILYKTGKKDELKKSLNKFLSYKKIDKFNQKLNAKKNCNKYTLYKHYTLFKKFLLKLNT